MQELSKIELELMRTKNNPVFTKRADKGYSVNQDLAKQIAITLNKIKGRIESEIGNTGVLEIEEFIQFKIDKKAGIMKNLDIFSESFESNGLDLTLLIDCSGSMRSLRQKLADLSSTLITALDKCSFIDFKVIAFSGKYHDYQSVIEIIKKVSDSGKIHADETDLHDIHNLAIDFAVNDINTKGNPDNKKLIIMITDGYPECELKHRSMDHKVLQNLMERSVINAKNYQIPIFCLYYGHIGSVKELMNRIFKGMIFESSNFEDIEKKLIQKLSLAVENLNKGMTL